MPLGLGAFIECTNSDEVKRAVSLAYTRRRLHCIWCSSDKACVQKGMRADHMLVHYTTRLTPSGDHVIFSVHSEFYQAMMEGSKYDEWRSCRASSLKIGAKAFIQCSKTNTKADDARAGKVGCMFTVDSIIAHEEARIFTTAKGSKAYNVQYVFKPSSLVCIEHPFDWTGTIHSSPVARDQIGVFANAALVQSSRVSYLPLPAASSADA